MERNTTMRKRERIIWLSACFLIIVIAVLVILSYQERLKNLNQRITVLEDSETIWLQKEVELTTEIANLEERIKQANNPQIIDNLRRQGFNGEVQEIVDDLEKHDELIPYEGVLGGKMGFYDKDHIFVISDRWVLAYFEDGHIGGNMLLRYSVENENISWEVIDSYILGE